MTRARRYLLAAAGVAMLATAGTSCGGDECGPHTACAGRPQPRFLVASRDGGVSLTTDRLEIDFGEVPMGATVRRAIELVNTGFGEATLTRLEVRDVSSGDAGTPLRVAVSGVTMPVVIRESEQVPLEATFTAPVTMEPRRSWEEIRLQFDDLSSPSSLSIDVFGTNVRR